MRQGIIVMVLFSFLVSCEEDNRTPSNTCSVNDPIMELFWLTNRVEEFEQSTSEASKYFYISQASYLGNTVFVLENCCPFCNTVISVFDCEGELLGILGTRDEDIDPDSLDNKKVIWHPEDSPCSF